jgi:hypothetical protein
MVKLRLHHRRNSPYNYSGAAFVTDQYLFVALEEFWYSGVDANNCSIPTNFNIKPESQNQVYSTKTDIKCYNDKGAIQFNVSNANGYTLAH